MLLNIRSWLVLSVVVLWTIYSVCEATYRKPPFNGSIFGKRSSLVTSSSHAAQDSDDMNNACELAASLIPVCNNWLNKLNEIGSKR